MQAKNIAAGQDAARAGRNIEIVQLEQVEEAKALLATATSGIAWPWDTLNDMTDTLIPGRLIIVGAYTGSGKTTMMLNAQRNFARACIPSLMFGTEQSAADLRIKQACTELGVPARDAMRKRIGSYWQERLNETLDDQAASSFAGVHLYNHPSPTPQQLEKEIREYADPEHGVKLFLIDYLGRVDVSSLRGEMYERMKALVQMLKNLAIQLKVTIIAANQIGKSEDRQLSRHLKPELSGLMGGQAIGHEADVVLGIYQPLKRGTTIEDRRRVALGEKELSSIVEQNTMAICLLKHREDLPLGVHAFFWVANNRIAPRRKDDLAPPSSMLNEDYAKDPRRAVADPSLPF